MCSILRSMAVSRRKPDPDRILMARLSGRAKYLVRNGASIDEAIADLCEMAGGRNDLLTEAGAIGVGAWTGRIGMPRELVADALILSAVNLPDTDEIRRWITEGHKRATTPSHKIG